MSCGVLLWGRAADVHRIFVLQKRAIRTMHGLGPRVSLREIEGLILKLCGQCGLENATSPYCRCGDDFRDQRPDVFSETRIELFSLTLVKTHWPISPWLGFESGRFYLDLILLIREQHSSSINHQISSPRGLEEDVVQKPRPKTDAYLSVSLLTRQYTVDFNETQIKQGGTKRLKWQEQKEKGRHGIRGGRKATVKRAANGSG
ncbi:hypothetical protein EVAR_80478_1 [Eumeta japonica]|uniref:Uncharacterized protein n=1 Tax=Eumeta variegata TaxID=151549 RepID=A0A4C1YP58_EUMVA|nr:hypothetical protein EVAR_80478_1 [Eumeta japonica]